MLGVRQRRPKGNKMLVLDPEAEEGVGGCVQRGCVTAAVLPQETRTVERWDSAAGRHFRSRGWCPW